MTAMFKTVKNQVNVCKVHMSPSWGVSLHGEFVAGGFCRKLVMSVIR